MNDSNRGKRKVVVFLFCAFATIAAVTVYFGPAIFFGGPTRQAISKSCANGTLVHVSISNPPIGGGPLLCTQISCPPESPCCNTCAGGGWFVRGSFIPARGERLPTCRVNDCGKFSSPLCQRSRAIGRFKDCDSESGTIFEVTEFQPPAI